MQQLLGRRVRPRLLVGGGLGVGGRQDRESLEAPFVLLDGLMQAIVGAARERHLNLAHCLPWAPAQNARRSASQSGCSSSQYCMSPYTVRP